MNPSYMVATIMKVGSLPLLLQCADYVTLVFLCETYQIR
jgi:hypothetical protein